MSSLRALPGRLGLAAVMTVLLTVALPAGAAEATTTVKHVAIVPSSSTCTSLIACYQPRSLKVLSRNKVIWSNTTGFSHTVSRCTVAACGVSGGTGADTLSSPLLGAGAKFAHTFTGKGTYVYYCQIHGYTYMHATVTVG